MCDFKTHITIDYQSSTGRDTSVLGHIYLPVRVAIPNPDCPTMIHCAVIHVDPAPHILHVSFRSSPYLFLLVLPEFTLLVPDACNDWLATQFQS
ncbi:hypothetical protein GDO81_018084 [Engystomops pustulosus]|uniref:Uncharacterized protein n=1 Tax=Engystomops pustulosus TaxID=76066 RepID=A0AAV7ABL9_ENGPU|nr:hypothetical protein GDO81_018084 [Engystomops pustulosus]